MPSPVCDADDGAFGHWTPLKPVDPCLERSASESSETRSPTSASSRSSPTVSEVSGASPCAAVSVRTRPTDADLAARFTDVLRLDRSKAVPMVLSMVSMLRRCYYEADVIAAVMALALVHLEVVFASLPTVGDDAEAARIAVMQCFNAHCYLIDEPCPLQYWQSNLYANYCSTRCLNLVAYKLLRVLKCSLRADEAAVAEKLELLGYGREQIAAVD